MGAARETCLLKTALTPSQQAINQIVIDMARLANLDESITDDQLAETFQTSKEEIARETVNGKEVLIIPYSDISHLEEVLERYPSIKEATYKEPGQQLPNSNQNTWVKVRHCPVKVDLARVMLLNNLTDWYGSIYPHRDGRSHTTASIKAPNEERQKDCSTRGI